MMNRRVVTGTLLGAAAVVAASVFETVAWSAPTRVNTTLYVRDREKIIALDLGAE